jgi:hypothetical protein
MKDFILKKDGKVHLSLSNYHAICNVVLTFQLQQCPTKLLSGLQCIFLLAKNEKNKKITLLKIYHC